MVIIALCVTIERQRRIQLLALTEILSKDEWGRFEKELFDRFHINATVYDTSGRGVTGKPNWCNRLCPQIKANPESLAAICATGNQHFMAQARQTRMPVIGECDAGFLKIAVPIFVEDEFMGTAGGCGLLPTGGEVETFLLTKTMGQREDQIAELCDGLGTMPQERAEEMATFIEQRIAQYMAEYRQASR
jgi:ligand-binding sensor protein